ncbi:hypothetical protein Ahy_A03g010956 isoform F [Arachis hypogaea]|uniref:Uncharacterized protein n=1 Tax=Arachis hypogaea TaxID=3818 RepID=A0A445DP40_ARAHY|nr:hypothetical protein Ahy_A03g010956 isoform F [Arachis hypogaea]
MNFLMRSTSHVHVERTPIPESPQADTPQTTSGTSSETLDSEDPYSRLSTIEEFDGEIDGENGNVSGNGSRKDMPILAKHVDVSEEEGWIAIPCKELPKSWNDVSDIQSLHSLDRSFLFPGEQVQIVACLSACKHDTEIITPFKVAAMMSKNGIGHSPEKQNGNIEDRSNSGSGEGQISSSSQEQKEESLSKPKADHPADVSAGESLLRMEVHKRQTALLLQRFENSHFFVRISEYDEPLWSKRSSSEKSSSSEFDDLKASTIGVRETAKDSSSISAIIDRGNFDANISGGVARNSVKCFALPNGDIVNVAPADAPDIVIFIDAITIVFDEATKSGLPSSLPISCIEAGHDHSLPNLALRRGEEHSFILKPATWKNLKMQDETNSQLSKSHSGNSASSLNSSPQSLDRRKAALNDDQYAIVVSCRCNYTASQLFFKQPTSWRPRTSRDILISVASEMSGESPGPYARNSPLPVQVLTLQASNFTSEDLTLTVLAPASFTSPPSVVSLNSPTSSMSPFVGFTEFLGRVNVERHTSVTQGQSFSPLVKENEKQSNHGAPQSSSMNDVIPSSGLSCTHLWLQSRVPLGCVPSQSTATIKLELLPLTDGIITLDSLQINVKEKGVAYIPEHSLKINATSSISKGII